jgi:hypothetical protein
MRFEIKSALLLASAAISLPGTAQAKSDEQIWATGSANVTLSEHWRLSQEVVVRVSDNRDGIYEVESNTMLGYKVSKDVTAAVGYTHSPQYSGGTFTAMEHRAREQVTIDNVARIGAGKLSLRVRTEQRWREGLDGTGWRVRPYAKLSVPLAHKVSLNLSSEPYFNLNRTAFQRTAGLDRMRNLVTLSTPLAKALTLEAGYMNQHGFVPGGPDTSDHVAYFAIGLNL